jgi:hypothetical protein
VKRGTLKILTVWALLSTRLVFAGLLFFWFYTQIEWGTVPKPW